MPATAIPLIVYKNHLHTHLPMKLHLLSTLCCCCLAAIMSAQQPSHDTMPSPMPADEVPANYLPLMAHKHVALFSNQTGCLSNGRHVLDILVEGGVHVTTLFSPEHGFRGTADAGEHVQSQTDSRTGIPILSLYDGQKPGPSDEAMRRFDLLVVDIQDVGLRFYTYYVTMLQLMRRCSEYGREVVILDRPNPNGHFVDGPLLDMSLKSGVGALPIPIVHGMTLGELATMAIGEGWTPHCRLTVVPCLHYTHQSPYHLPIPPSPNLPDMRAVLLYPSTCCFEGTVLSLGRGTDHPFQCYGHPLLQGCDFSFTPTARPGAKHPPLEGQCCQGVDLSHIPIDSLLRLSRIDLGYIVDAYRRFPDKAAFWLGDGNFFDKLMGQRYVRQMIIDGQDAHAIEATWRHDVVRFVEQRKPYLLYPIRQGE